MGRKKKPELVDRLSAEEEGAGATKSALGLIRQSQETLTELVVAAFKQCEALELIMDYLLYCCEQEEDEGGINVQGLAEVVRGVRRALFDICTDAREGAEALEAHLKSAGALDKEPE